MNVIVAIAKDLAIPTLAREIAACYRYSMTTTARATPRTQDKHTRPVLAIFIP